MNSAQKHFSSLTWRFQWTVRSLTDESKMAKLLKKAYDFKDLLQDFSLHKVTKPLPGMNSVRGHFEPLHGKLGWPAI